MWSKTGLINKWLNKSLQAVKIMWMCSWTEMIETTNLFKEKMDRKWQATRTQVVKMTR